MKDIRDGIYSEYKNNILRLSKKESDIDGVPDGYYLVLVDYDGNIDEKCIERYSGTEYAYYIRPVISDEIECLYEIDYYVICNGRKYESFIRSKGESELWVYACSNYNRDNIELDSKYRVVEDGRDGVFLAVPFEDVELYETKTYYDKDKFINEDERVVLSEETYLIDEPWWLEETKDN